jgi:hypothetical protein
VRAAAPRLTATPNPLSFGTVNVGSSSTRAVSLTNTGTAPLTISSVTAPTAPFGATGLPAVGAVIAPGSSVTVNVTLQPTASGTIGSSLAIGSNGGTATVPLSADVWNVLPATADTSAWRLNGDATRVTGGVRLTPSTTNRAGSAFSNALIPSTSIVTDFDLAMSGGSGGVGLTFTIADPSSRSTALGGRDVLLGFGGIPGTAVGFVTTKFSGAPSNNFVGVAPTARGSTLSWLATNTAVPALRPTTRHVTVTVSPTRVVVAVDGVQYLSQAVTVPSSVRPGFTASTGSPTDNHTVSNVVVRYR